MTCRHPAAEEAPEVLQPGPSGVSGPDRPGVLACLDALEEDQARAARMPGAIPGFFYHERHLPWLGGYRRRESTVFFQSLSVLTLQGLRPWLTEGEQARVDGICRAIKGQYWRFRSAAGLPGSYAFWATRPQRAFFPGGRAGHRDEFFRPPDDADDTALIHLTSPHPPHVAKWLRDVKLPGHVNGRGGRWVRSSLPHWNRVPAYTTFFARDMPPGLDVAVLANVLLWVTRQGFPLTAPDQASLRLILDVLEGGWWSKAPYRSSPYYPRPAAILYTLTRLAAEAPTTGPWAGMLSAARAAVGEALSWPNKAHLPLEWAMLHTSAVRLGMAAPPPPACLDLESDDRVIGDRRFSFFVLPLAAEFVGRFPRWLAPWPGQHVRFHCPAFNRVHLMEYRLVTGEVGLSTPPR